MRTDEEIRADWPFAPGPPCHPGIEPLQSKGQRLILEVLLDIRRAVLEPAEENTRLPYEKPEIRSSRVEWKCPRCQAATFDAPTRSNAYGSVCQKCAEALNLNRS